MGGKSKRQVTTQTKTKNEARSLPDSHYHQPRKDRNSSARHSYHQINGSASYNGCGPLYDQATAANDNYGEHRSFVTRERSFVRPQSTFAQLQGKQHISEGFNELHRQRSFVTRSQLQNMQGKDQQKRRSGMPAVNHRGKPAMEIYRPPTLRSSTIFEANGDAFYGYKNVNEMYDPQGNFIPSVTTSNFKRPGLNIHAKEFVSYQGDSSPSLHHSKSSGNIFQVKHSEGLQHSKSGHNLRGISSKQEGAHPSKVHFNDNKENDPETKLGMTPRIASESTTNPYSAPQNPIKRSKSLGAADLRQALNVGQEPLANIGPFPQEVHNVITEAMNDPNKLSARQLMEVVRHVFSRVIEASRHSEPTARICISIIEKERGETFLETLLNTCQEYYQERDRLLRTAPYQSSPYPSYVASYPRWIAYMSFLNEMYTQLKRRHIQLMTLKLRNSETPPGLHLLTLLAQCCYVCLRESSVNSLPQTECLFFVLTAVGKDIEVKLPQHMTLVIGAARDAFLTTVHVPAVRKTLLQLIEMHAARWQLPAPAVMYYYPGSGAK